MKHREGHETTRSGPKVQLNLTVQVTDREALLTYVKERYAACWFENGWEPDGLPEAVLEALVLSNENPSPCDYGIEIVDSEAAEAP